VNTQYDVYVTRNYNDLAFAYANKPTATGYAPAASGSWNPSTVGTIRVTRSGVGSYSVNFRGLGDVASAASNGGHFQVNAVDAGKAYCTVGGWGGAPNLFVSVVCFNRAGNPI